VTAGQPIFSLNATHPKNIHNILRELLKNILYGAIINYVYNFIPERKLP
jgi:hypothetical protein